MTARRHGRPVTLLDFALVGIVLVACVAAALLWLLRAEARWRLDIEQSAQVGMAIEEVTQRLGPPDKVYRGTSPDSAAWGFESPESPIEHELWVWSFTSPTHCWWRLSVHVDEDGRVTHTFMGGT